MPPRKTAKELEGSGLQARRYAQMKMLSLRQGEEEFRELHEAAHLFEVLCDEGRMELRGDNGRMMSFPDDLDSLLMPTEWEPERITDHFRWVMGYRSKERARQSRQTRQGK